MFAVFHGIIEVGVECGKDCTEVKVFFESVHSVWHFGLDFCIG